MADREAELVQAYVAAMRQGPDGEDDLVALFTEDAVYEEPFVDASTPAVGREAIRTRLRTGWAEPLPDMTLDVVELATREGEATMTWVCRSPALPTGAVRGTDHYRFRDGAIAHLSVRIDGPVGPPSSTGP